jgi:hypothetical protein
MYKVGRESNKKRLGSSSKVGGEEYLKNFYFLSNERKHFSNLSGSRIKKFLLNVLMPDGHLLFFSSKKK